MPNEIEDDVLQRNSISGSQEQLAALRSEIEAVRQESRALRNDIVSRFDEIQTSLFILEAALGSMHGADSSGGEAQARYRHLVLQVRKLVHAYVPQDATLLIVNKGDEDLLRLYGRTAWHFPQGKNGVYAGHYPATSAEAIAHLEELRTRGADFLVFPNTAFWWLEHYTDLNQHLKRTYRLIHRTDNTCLIFALRQPSPWAQATDLINNFKKRYRRFPAILNWDSGVDFAKVFPESTVFAPLDADLENLPYVDKSIDIVALRSGKNGRLEEALRVASEAVLICSLRDGAQHDFEVLVEYSASIITS